MDGREHAGEIEQTRRSGWAVKGWKYGRRAVRPLAYAPPLLHLRSDIICREINYVGTLEGDAWWRVTVSVRPAHHRAERHGRIRSRNAWCKDAVGMLPCRRRSRVAAACALFS